jgi:hypothetical protein
MEDPLLPLGEASEKTKRGGGGGGQWRERMRSWKAEMKDEGRKLGHLAGPMVAVTLAQYLVQVPPYLFATS